MGDRLQTGKPSRYVTSHPGQLSVWISTMSTSENQGVNRHTARCTSPVSAILQCKLVYGWVHTDPSLCWQEALHMKEMEGVQALRVGGARGRGRSGRRHGHNVPCCSLDLFCYECRRRKREHQQSDIKSLPTPTTAVIIDTRWHWHCSIGPYWPVTYARHL